MKNTIAIDIDGVIADFEEEFCDRFGSENRQYSRLSQRYPEISRDLIDEFANNPNVYSDLRPIFGGILLCHQARERGMYILLITSRPKHLENVTRLWLERYAVSYNELIFSNHKSDTISLYNEKFTDQTIRCLVDDITTNLEDLPKNVIGVGWAQPWNDGYYPKAYHDERSMRVMLKLDTESPWRGFWSNKDES